MIELRQQLEDRVEILTREAELGEQRLQTLERESAALQQTLLRISGALQVLREVLDADQPQPLPEDRHESSERDRPAPATSQ